MPYIALTFSAEDQTILEDLRLRLGLDTFADVLKLLAHREHRRLMLEQQPEVNAGHADKGGEL